MKKYLIYTFVGVWVLALLAAAAIGLYQQTRGTPANETILQNRVVNLLNEKQRFTLRNHEVEQLRLSLEQRVLELKEEVRARMGDIKGLNDRLANGQKDIAELDLKLEQAQATIADKDALIQSLSSP